jgi:glycosyltransferase involved in cell wall biosynthesis
MAAHRAIGSFDSVDRFLAVSRFVARKHVAAGLPAHKMEVKPNFCWPAPRREGPGGYYLYLGRLAPEKGLRTILEVWKHRPETLLVAGDGPDAAALQRSAPDTVRFLGVKSPQEVVQLIAQARALLVPSRWYEGAPRTMIEAYASGVPVVAHQIGAIPELVDDGSTGFLIPLDDLPAWHRALDLLADDTHSTELGEIAYRRWRAQHSPEAAGAALELAYVT